MNTGKKILKPALIATRPAFREKRSLQKQNNIRGTFYIAGVSAARTTP